MSLDIPTIQSAEHDKIVREIANKYKDPDLARFAINDYRDYLLESLGFAGARAALYSAVPQEQIAREVAETAALSAEINRDLAGEGPEDGVAEQAARVLERTEVFENETTLFYTYEVDPAYREIVDQMASAMWDHDHKSEQHGLFPTGDESTDSPYRCRADDALREALPLLRAKFAADLRRGDS